MTMRRIAMDSARRARDEEQDDTGGTVDAGAMKKVLGYLSGSLDPDDLATIRSVLGKYCDLGAQDDPASFGGMPRTGGGMDPLAGDRARRAQGFTATDRSGFARRFPDAMRIGRA